MYWLLGAARRLKEMGILGMNRRNAACILDHNPRVLYPLVDDKLRMRDLCQRIGVPTPAIFAEISSHSMLGLLEAGDLRLEAGQAASLASSLQSPSLQSQASSLQSGDFVIKPNRGAAGRGVLVLTGRAGKDYVRHNGKIVRPEQIRQHLSDILSGMYSLAGHPDRALIQQRVRLHPAFQEVLWRGLQTAPQRDIGGIPDIRVIVYRNRPAMAMLRLPTKASNGRANLHQGGIGAGVNLSDGRTHRAVHHHRCVERHPDTGVCVLGMRVPCWNQVIDMAGRVAEAVGLGYIGVDIVVDETQGPMLLEANARPGLAIQIANGRGLLPRLQEIDREAEQAEKDRIVPKPGVIAKIGPAYRKSA